MNSRYISGFVVLIYLSNSQNFDGGIMWTPLTCLRSSKSLSPVTTHSHSPARAVPITISSSASLQICRDSSMGDFTSNRDMSNLAELLASSEVKPNFPTSLSVNSSIIKWEIITSWWCAQYSSYSLHVPWEMKAAIRTLVSNTIFMIFGQRHLDLCGCRVELP